MHGDSKLPLLDVKMWITTLEGKGTQLMHEYYLSEEGGIQVGGPCEIVTPLEHQENCFDPGGASYTAEVFARPSVD